MSIPIRRKQQQGWMISHYRMSVNSLRLGRKVFHYLDPVKRDKVR